MGSGVSSRSDGAVGVRYGNVRVAERAGGGVGEHSEPDAVLVALRVQGREAVDDQGCEHAGTVQRVRVVPQERGGETTV